MYNNWNFIFIARNLYLEFVILIFFFLRVNYYKDSEIDLVFNIVTDEFKLIYLAYDILKLSLNMIKIKIYIHNKLINLLYYPFHVDIISGNIK